MKPPAKEFLCPMDGAVCKLEPYKLHGKTAYNYKCPVCKCGWADEELMEWNLKQQKVKIITNK